MSYKKVDPIPHKIMMSRKYSHHNTICGKLRKLYQIITELSSGDNLVHPIDNEDVDRICHELAICMAMAKKMHKRLQYYKSKEVG